MKYFLSLFTLSMLLFCNSLSAQKKNCPGLYISQQGDTVKGVFPKYAQWTKNPSQVDFSNEGSVNLVQLTPQNTRYFLVEGNDEYLSYTGSRLLNPIEDAVLFNEKSVVDSEDSIQQVSTFLRLVKKTPGISLYILNDNKRVNFFYQLPGQPIIELRYKKAFNQNQIHEMAEYRQQLYNLFTDIITQQDLTSALEKLPYQERDIASFLETLLPGSKDERKKLNRRTDWVLSAGATLNMINVRAEEFYAAVPGTNSSVSPLISAGFIIPIDRNFGRFFFYPQLKLFRY